MRKRSRESFQGIIFQLQEYWSQHGCAIVQPLDMEVGSGTSHPMTFLQALGPKPVAVAYIQPSRRPTDGRYGGNPNRLQRYYQFQVIIKPSPDNIQELYLGSLEFLGISPATHDIRFVEDNWENPTLGAWGMGWEVWLSGMEISQFTYFQQVGGLKCKPITGEITYGVERLAMYVQGVDSVYNLVWADSRFGNLTYGDITYQDEVEQSAYNFEHADIGFLLRFFDQCEKECEYLLNLKKPLSIPAYEQVLKAAYTFNLLDARKAISVTERQHYILRIRNLTKEVAKAYCMSRGIEY